MRHFWVTEWESGRKADTRPEAERIGAFLKARGARSAVLLGRPQKGIPAEPVALLGEPPAEPFEVDEHGARYWIRLREVRHPGLFLDHAPLRQWLRGQARGCRVLNTFAYTGSSSVAARAAGCATVVSVDANKRFLSVLKDSFAKNKFPFVQRDSTVGDFFSVMARLKRVKTLFDCVILDPPFFAQNDTGGVIDLRCTGSAARTRTGSTCRSKATMSPNTAKHFHSRGTSC